MLSRDSFGEFVADQQLVLYLNIATRIPTDPHQELIHRAGGGASWPRFAVMNADGEFLQVHHGARNLEALAYTLDKARRSATLAVRAAEGDRDARRHWLRERLEHRIVGVDAAKAELDALAVEGAERAEFERLVIDLEVVTVYGTIATRDDIPAAAARFEDMIVAGRRPSDFEAGRLFWGVLATGAVQQRDLRMVRRVLAALEQEKSDRYTELLRQLRAGARALEQQQRERAKLEAQAQAEAERKAKAALRAAEKKAKAERRAARKREWEAQKKEYEQKNGGGG